MKRPAVTVVIPTYNRYSMLCEAIDSILGQTDDDYELIVVDDGSTDATGTLRDLYQGRLRYIYQENRGASAARNRGISEAAGKWVSFLDSDDLWLPKKLEVQRTAMEKNPEVPLSYTEEVWYRQGVRVNPKKKHAKHGGRIFEKCLPLCIISPSSVMIEKGLLEEVGGFDESLPVCEDYDLWLRMTKDHPVHLVREPLIVKRNGHPGQLSDSGWGFDRYRVQSIAGLIRGGDLTGAQAAEAFRTLEQKCRVLSQGFRRRGHPEQGRVYEALCSEMRRLTL